MAWCLRVTKFATSLPSIVTAMMLSKLFQQINIFTFWTHFPTKDRLVLRTKSGGTDLFLQTKCHSPISFLFEYTLQHHDLWYTSQSTRYCLKNRSSRLLTFYLVCSICLWASFFDARCGVQETPFKQGPSKYNCLELNIGPKSWPLATTNN